MTFLPALLKEPLSSKESKILFSFFLLLILVFLGLRLWADVRFKAVPYPNLLAISAEGVAVQAGPAVYLYSLDGVAIRTFSLPEDVQPTQLFWDKGMLAIADMRSKEVRILNDATDKTWSLSEAKISAQFKVLRDPASENFYVSDGANHRILVFDASHKYLRTFGNEGNRPGEFRFPNNMLFDEAGNLLVANTKRSRIEVFGRDGKYLKTLLTNSDDRTYRYATDFAITPDKLIVLENDGYLERAKVRLYDRNGVKFGDLDIGNVEVVGSLVTYDDTIYLTDSGGRQLLAFSLKDQRPLGTFSYDFAGKCDSWGREAKLFGSLSCWALIAMLIVCAPIIICYLKNKRQETKEISRFSLGTLNKNKEQQDLNAPSDLILSNPANKRQALIAAILFGVCVIGMLLVPILGKIFMSARVFLMIAVLLSLIGLIGSIRLFVKSGIVSAGMRKRTETFIKKIIHDGKLVLLPEEQVEKVALVQQNKSSAFDYVLLMFTTKRLLLYYISWDKITEIEQISFSSISRDMQRPSRRFIDGKPRLQLTMMINGKKRDFAFYHINEEFLQFLQQEFLSRVGRQGEIQYARLCLSCAQPLQGDYCLSCATKQTHDVQSVWLSLLFPGLGQLRNGEMQKGLVYVVIATIFILVGYLGLKGWFFEGADLNVRDKAQLISLMIFGVVFYISNVIDAYRSSMRAKKSDNGIAVKK